MDRVMGGLIPPNTLLPKLTLKYCGPFDSVVERSSLKLIRLAELTATGVVTRRLPRLTVIGPVRPELFPLSTSSLPPVLVRPVVETRDELMKKLAPPYWCTSNSPPPGAVSVPPVIVPPNAPGVTRIPPD